MTERFEMIAKTLQGLEEILAEELTTLSVDDLQIGRRMVSFTGTQETLYRANFSLRTAIRILKPIASFRADNIEQMYEGIKKINWEKYLTVDQTFVIDSTIYSDEFRHSKFVQYKAKDAIADYFIEKYEKRPSVRITNPDIYLNVHIAQNRCTISLDSSGESLHKRGYRKVQTEAPINEVLAAGIILKSGWKGNCPLLDPFCGSGTFLIEAAMIALNVAPGVFRQGYAFEKWKDFDAELFETVYEDESAERTFEHKIYGSDLSPRAIQIAQENISSTGLGKYIELDTLNFASYETPPAPNGMIITNPPYGERVSSRDLLGLYTTIGERLKHIFTGYTAWIISYHDECFDKIGLKPTDKATLINGSLECELRKYEIFSGKHKDFVRESPRLSARTFTSRQDETSSDRPARSDDRSRPFDRRREDADKPRFERSDDRTRSFDRNRENADKPRFERSEDRPRSFDRNRENADKPRFERSDDRTRSFDRNRDNADKPRFERSDDRPRPFDRNRENADKPRFERSDDRSRSFDRNRDNAAKPRFERSDDRPRSFDRNRENADKPRFERSEDRSRSFDRNRDNADKPRFERSDDRPRSFDRNRGNSDKPQFDRSGDRPRSSERTRINSDKPQLDRSGDRPRPLEHKRDEPSTRPNRNTYDREQSAFVKERRNRK